MLPVVTCREQVDLEITQVLRYPLFSDGHLSTDTSMLVGKKLTSRTPKTL